MPVLLKPDGNNPFSSVDVENLVVDVRERLCLKNPEILYQYDYESYNNSALSAPFCRRDHIASPKDSLRRGSSFTTMSKSTPKMVGDYHSKKKYQKISSSVLNMPYDRKTLFDRDLKPKDKPSKCKYEDPHKLLQKLLSEQSLIQEAVKRLNFQKSTKNFQDVRNASDLGLH